MDLWDEFEHTIKSIQGAGRSSDLAKACLRGIALLRELPDKAELFGAFREDHPPPANGTEAAQSWLHALNGAIRQALVNQLSLALKTMHMTHGLREFFPFDETTTLLDVERHLLRSYRHSINEYITRSTPDLLPDEPLRLDFYSGVPSGEGMARPLDPETRVSTLPEADTDGVYWWPRAKENAIRQRNTPDGLLLSQAMLDLRTAAREQATPIYSLADYGSFAQPPSNTAFGLSGRVQALSTRLLFVDNVWAGSAYLPEIPEQPSDHSSLSPALREALKARLDRITASSQSIATSFADANPLDVSVLNAMVNRSGQFNLLNHFASSSRSVGIQVSIVNHWDVSVPNTASLLGRDLWSNWLSQDIVRVSMTDPNVELDFGDKLKKERLQELEEKFNNPGFQSPTRSKGSKSAHANSRARRQKRGRG